MIEGEELQSHERHLWGLCYRMTGSAADADDLVQETFVRALASPPSSPGPLRPWLSRVAINLGRDLLRARKRQGYAGPWLPSPVPTHDAEGLPLPDVELASTEGRYDLLESVSFAFLLALEGLTPKQRAVLILRDVLDAPVAEAAEALGLSEANVKTTLHRARAAMASYDQRRPAPDPRERAHLRERNQTALFAFLEALQRGDHDAMVALLRSDAVGLTDGGGVYSAARVPVLGAAKLALFLRKVGETRGPPLAFSLALFNGLPALVASHETRRPTDAPLSVLRCEIDEAGLISQIHIIMAPRKLHRVTI